MDKREDEKLSATKPLTEDEKRELRGSFNARVSRACSWLALVIILVDLGAFVLGKFEPFTMCCGIMVSIALLAIASLNHPSSL